MKQRKKVLLVAHNLDDFVGQDLEILKKHYDVRIVADHKDRMKSTLKMIRGVKWCDLCYIWFAANYAAMATSLCKVFQKKSIVIAGGYDVVHMPEIGYGLLCDKKTAIYPKTAIKYADKILTFSDASKKDTLKNFKIKDKNKVETMYLYIDPKKYPAPKKPKLKIVLTIGEIRDSTIKRKGHETFVKAAAYLPDYQFILIGKHVDDTINILKKIAPPNVAFPGFVSLNEMMQTMQNAKVYCQVSAHEGFGFSLAEAMLCECIPICTRRGSLPEVGGPSAYFVPNADPKKTADAIKKALNDESGRGKKARKHIVKNYPRSRREKLIVEHINKLLKN
ncbi:MAG: glycosyltransferase [Nanoarchaeota archaeon]|nr:glycosyltransferase [Nanoarchaeota archaeon]